MQPAQMRSGGSGSSVMTDTDYAEAVSFLLVLMAQLRVVLLYVCLAVSMCLIVGAWLGVYSFSILSAPACCAVM